jgi:parallel beta-helix repeat protein
MRWMGLAVVAALLGEARAVTFTVTNTSAAGDGSLAQAIADANTAIGPDTITFAIADAGVPRITTAALPDVTDPVTIDGTTQAGGLVELRAATAGSGSGLRIAGGGSTVRGLVINRWSRGIELRALGGNVVEGNLIGTDVPGTHPLPNVDGVLIDGSPNNRIGGTTAAARNLISGNTTTGIRVQGTSATANAIEGNRIGTDISGSEALRNPTGISILDGASGTRVGGTIPGAGNLISGNGTGIRLGVGAEDSSIEGNLIGTDAGGSAPLGNVSEGVFVAGARRTRIGGPGPEARNVISANGNGVEIETNATLDTLVEGNYIGIDSGGMLDLGNTIGVLLTGSTRTRVTGNTISGNQNGINVASTTADADLRVEANRIGTNPAGTAAIGNHRGILLASGTAIAIGGSEPAAGNVISGNGDLGIFASNLTTGVVIEQNRIGTASDGATTLGNGGDGIRLAGGGNTIRANVIAFNGAIGVALVGGVGNAVRANAIFDNGGLGIDLGTLAGVTPNDATDADNGANGLQNFPVLDRPLIGGSTVGGTLRSKGGTDFIIEVFANLACDPTTYGEGRELLGTVTATTDGNGLASFMVTVGHMLGTEVLTATATDPDGNTSEFSACVIPAEFVTTTTLDPTTTSVTTTSSTTTTSETTPDGSTSSTSTSSSSTTLGSESTSSTASTSSSVSVTTSTVGISPSTTLPLPIGCAIVPVGPTFPSFRCRLEALRVQTETESALGVLRVKLLAGIAKARARGTQAEESCTAGRVKEPKARLRQMRRQLARYRRRLRMLAARHQERAAVAGPLADAALALRDDVRALRRTLNCRDS